MTSGGQTPEELETLLEDSFVLRDGAGLARLFERDGVLVRGSGEPVRREHIAGYVSYRGYLAAPLRVVQARDTALVVSASGLNVARRGRDRSWRYAIAFLDPAVSAPWATTRNGC